MWITWLCRRSNIDSVSISKAFRSVLAPMSQWLLFNSFCCLKGSMPRVPWLGVLAGSCPEGFPVPGVCRQELSWSGTFLLGNCGLWFPVVQRWSGHGCERRAPSTRPSCRQPGWWLGRRGTWPSTEDSLPSSSGRYQTQPLSCPPTS